MSGCGRAGGVCDFDSDRSDLRSFRNCSGRPSHLQEHADDGEGLTNYFLDDASSHMHEEQTELLAKVNRLTIPVRVFATGSGIFLLVLGAMWFYQKLNGIRSRERGPVPHR